MITFGSLFAGIGGMDLGLERAGMRAVWQVEINPFCRCVLARHWPDVRRHDDVCTFPPPGDWFVDLIAGGFPCQDVSDNGKRVGITGKQSGLWREFARIVGALRPQFVLIENVAALARRGLSVVLSDLAVLGYDAEWSVVPACAVGAQHRRERLFVVAHSNGKHGNIPSQAMVCREKEKLFGSVFTAVTPGDWPANQHSVVGGPYGSTEWVDRVTAIGNAVVPQVAELIGRAILAL